MAPCSTTGLSLRSCYAPPAKGAQPMLSKPMFDDFNDLVIAADEAAVCEVLLLCGPITKATADKTVPTIAISSRQPSSDEYPAHQPSCLPFAKLPSMQTLKACSDRMLTSIKWPLSKLNKLCKRSSKAAATVTAKPDSNKAGVEPEEANTSRHHSGIGHMLSKLSSWSSTGSSSSSSGHSMLHSGSVLKLWSPRTSSSSSSGSSSLCDNPTGSSTQSPRESLSNCSDLERDSARDSAYESDTGSFSRVKDCEQMNRSADFDDQQHQQVQQQQEIQQQDQHDQEQEAHEEVHRPQSLHRSRCQAAAAAALRQLQLDRADQELQAWATASRGWSRNIAGYGPSWGATRQPGGTVTESAGFSYCGRSLY